VFAILNLVFGGIGLLCNMCGILGQAFAMSIPMAGPPGAGGKNPMMEAFGGLEKEIPGYTAYQFSTLAVGFILCAMLVLSGIGLLNMKRWARWLCVGTSVAIILYAIGTAAYTIAYVQPALERLQRHIQEEIQKQTGGPTPNPFAFLTMAGTVSAVLTGLVKIAYAVGLLVVMFLPGVSAAFAGRPMSREADEEYDDYEDDYDDRRRPRRERPDGEG
jgi:hypothetical protein